MFKYTGSSLLEILICFTLISIMLLSLDVVQIKTMQAAQTSYYFSTATQQISNMIEQLKIAKQADAMMINTWNQQNAELLPNGRGEIIGEYPQFILKLMWGKQSTCTQTKINRSGCLMLDLHLSNY
jgi:hypothetical protein